MAGPTNPGSVSFTAPTKFTNGATIPSNGILRYEYGFGTTSGTYTRIVADTDFTAVGTKQVGTIPNDLAEGQWFAAVRTVAVGGGVSAWSNEAPFVVELVAVAVTDFSVS
jgi:hypothetical protein